jgi:uncharacterized protein
MAALGARRVKVGIISDTHGLFRPEVVAAFKGVKLILHAGDIGTPEVLVNLESIAPVIAVRGNNDKAPWARDIPEVQVAEFGPVLIYMLHDLNELDLTPATAGFQVVVTGHSHKPLIQTRDEVLYVNPGSAGPRRFNLPVSVARLLIRDSTVKAEIIELL